MVGVRRNKPPRSFPLTHAHILSRSHFSHRLARSSTAWTPSKTLTNSLLSRRVVGAARARRPAHLVGLLRSPAQPPFPSTVAGRPILTMTKTTGAGPPRSTRNASPRPGGRWGVCSRPYCRPPRPCPSPGRTSTQAAAGGRAAGPGAGVGRPGPAAWRSCSSPSWRGASWSAPGGCGRRRMAGRPWARPSSLARRAPSPPRRLRSRRRPTVLAGRGRRLVMVVEEAGRGRRHRRRRWSGERREE
jgi:hypothetical protein